MSNTVLITGATSGFGKATAEKFAANNWNIIITGRRAERLTTLEKELQEKYKVQVHLAYALM
jgi:3-hydroxy acid dehydrogenase/malonic semialdehyde reductase